MTGTINKIIRMKNYFISKNGKIIKEYVFLDKAVKVFNDLIASHDLWENDIFLFDRKGKIFVNNERANFNELNKLCE